MTRDTEEIEVTLPLPALGKVLVTRINECACIHCRGLALQALAGDLVLLEAGRGQLSDVIPDDTPDDLAADAMRTMVCADLIGAGVAAFIEKGETVDKIQEWFGALLTAKLQEHAEAQHGQVGSA